MAVILCGCGEQKSSTVNIDNDLFVKTDSFEQKNVDSAGDVFSFFNKKIHFDIPENTISDNMTLVVTELSGFPNDPYITFLDVYSFEPEDIDFNKPVTVKIRYDRSKIPSDIPDEKIMLFFYSDNDYWELIPDSAPFEDYIEGEVDSLYVIASGFIG